MKINILIDTWEMNSAGIREITNPSERPNKVYDVVEGEKIVVIGYDDGAEELSFKMEDITDHSVVLQCFQPLFVYGEGSGDLTRFTVEEGKELILDTPSDNFGFRFTITLVKDGAPIEATSEESTPIEDFPVEAGEDVKKNE